MQSLFIELSYSFTWKSPADVQKKHLIDHRQIKARKAIFLNLEEIPTPSLIFYVSSYDNTARISTVPMAR